MSWSHEDNTEKPTLADAVISSLKRARAALEAKAEGRPASAAQITSKDWMPYYEDQPLSVDLAFEQVFEGDPLVPGLVSPDDAASSNYFNEYNKVFSSPETPLCSNTEEVAASNQTPALTEDLPAVDVPKAPARKRRRRKGPREPEVRTYVDHPTEIDVLLGRGGLSNHHPGNKRYRDEVGNMQAWYKSSPKDEKTDLSQHLVDYVHSYGGRFLKKDTAMDKWYIVPNIVARKKASQALREHKTPEERALAKLHGSNLEST